MADAVEPESKAAYLGRAGRYRPWLKALKIARKIAFAALQAVAWLVAILAVPAYMSRIIAVAWMAASLLALIVSVVAGDGEPELPDASPEFLAAADPSRSH